MAYPQPSTYSTLMYYTELDPWSRKPLFVEKDPNRKQQQKDMVTEKNEWLKPKRYGANSHGSKKRYGDYSR